MAAYMLILAAVHDREAFRAGYGAKVARLVERFGGRYRLLASGAETLEGGLGDGRSVVISEWPDAAAARRFWHSPEYRELVPLRAGICDAEVVLVEGDWLAATDGASGDNASGDGGGTGNGGVRDGTAGTGGGSAGSRS